MAANTFTTILHKNCHKIIVILVYAILEWILMLLLFLNSLFSYLILMFTKYFGLKPFCTFCSRLDHIFDGQKHKNSYLDHVCEAHMIEISSLSYCSNHERLSESKNMCSNCSSTYALFSWTSQGVSENEGDRCSCCNEILTRKFFKPTWDVLDYIQEKTSSAEVIDAGQDSDTTAQSKSLSEADRMNHDIDQFEDKRDDCDDSDQGAFECEKLGTHNQSNDDPDWNLGCNEDDESVSMTDMLLQNAEDIDSDRFICIELIGTEPLMANGSEDVEDEEEDEDECDIQDEDVEKCKKSGSDVVFSTSRMKEDSAEAEEVEGLDNFPDKQVEGEKYSLEKVGSRLEDSFGGSVISNNEESMTIEDLKSIIKAQKIALNELYVELEEERKAAAIAANETMAMITKLQEEKAIVKIEALQYQRMMEEQVEYDQEALQLLNNLVTKREKEKQELEKELEVYRNKVLGYETREKMAIVRSNDDRSVDLNECDDGSFDSDQERDLDDDLEDLDIRDISLELKALEAKVFAIHADEPQVSKDVRDFDALRHEEKEVLDSSCNDPNVKYHFDRKTEDLKATKLLPLFDTIENEYAEEDINKTELDKSKFFIQEEFSHVYERLQALEADKEFLKHCISSMMKGNKGLSLLQEILQHLRDLRKTEDLKATKLLPLFDTIENEYAEEDINNKSKFFIQEEFSHVYERLQALEADKEFLKHCISSMMKGNKGLSLLQEILQHLRDLRSAELAAGKLHEIPSERVSLCKED
ncbi:hypothetical protein CDL12_03600 [Handroanthus impetiginosus]|uniref:GTD-binding domain-containing protein n=1 Tax=Handroanthus impetiginosus TaxID=429701 RepID=A0A2G9I1N2_9LAMI|nr:hypothetical protein CDL12_03600 [Handroanthus impetiginosus]